MAQSSPISLLAKAANRDDQFANIAEQRLIGQLLSQSTGLLPEDINVVLQRQQEHGGRFGQIAIALRLVSPEDVFEALARQFDYPCLSSLDRTFISAELSCAWDPFGDQAQSFRDLRTELLTGVLNDAPASALAILSTQGGDGRSYVAANLAVAFAQLGGRTLLVDADFRSPRQHMLFGVSDTPGLSQLLCHRASAEEALQATRLPRLSVVSAGPVPPNPLELLLRGSFAKSIRAWLNQFDYVVVDTPPASEGTQARVIADAAGAALVLAKPHSSRVADLARLTAAIDRGQVQLAGVVINES